MKFIASGIHSVKEILNSNFFHIRELLLRNDHEKDKNLLNLIKERNINFKIVNKDNFFRYGFGKGNQGIVAIIDSYKYFFLNDLLKKINEKNNFFFIVLDSIEDPHNFGAILRTCAFFGVDGVLIGKNNQCPVNSTVIKVSTGGIAHVPVFTNNNLEISINEIKKIKSTVLISTICSEYFHDNEEKNIILDIDTINSLKKKWQNKNIFLILGNEGIGINKRILKKSDYFLNIHSFNKNISSLNVSVSCGVILSWISNKSF